MKQSDVSIGLINPKSPDNVHAVMRAAGNFRVNRVLYTGVRYKKAVTLNPNAPDISRKVSQAVELSQVSDLLENIPEKTKIICIEFAENALPLTGFAHPTNALYVFGPEDNTIDQTIIDKADAVVYVPTVGCLNLAATVNIVLYDRLSKSSERNDFENNALILQSRDTNNSLVVNDK